MLASPGTPGSDRIYQITAHFQTKDAVHECDVRHSPHCAGNVTGGVNMVYLSHHCHAPSCLKAELWNADTGELICRQVPHVGASKTASPTNPYDEQGYIAIPPCLFSDDAADGLEPTKFLRYDQNLTSIKWNNNTYYHYGEMAMWQMRGYQSYEA